MVLSIEAMYQMELTTGYHQEQSRLCSLPAEIRARVFAIALTAYDNPFRQYRADRKYYRPGYQYRRKINISLLLSCKKVYSEARLLPLRVNEHVFWLFGGPFGQSGRNTAQWIPWYFDFNEDQKRAIQTVHIFTQQVYLEKLKTTDARRFPPRTACLHLTFRHGDWWSREAPPASSDRLGICPWRRDRTSCQEMLAEPTEPSFEYIKQHMTDWTWGGAVCEIVGLRKLILEFEIDDKKRSQLDVVVERAKHWRFPLAHEDFVLGWDGRLEESVWEGLRDLKDDFQLLREQPVKDDAPKRNYCVVKMTWKAVTVASSVVVVE